MKELFPGFMTTTIDRLPLLNDVKPLLNTFATIPENFLKLNNSYEIRKGRELLDFYPDVEKMSRLELEDYKLKGSISVENSFDNMRTCFDLKKEHSYLTKVIENRLSHELKSNVINEGIFFYPKHGYRGWHTNIHDRIGWRMYVVLTKAIEKSFFRALNPFNNSIETVYDIPGRVNLFYIGKSNPIWHCIAADDANRWSCGFSISDQAFEILTKK